MKRILGAAALAVLVAGGANAEVLKCKMQTSSGIQKGWIAPEIYLALGEDGILVQVFDGIIYEANKEKPLEAKVSQDDDRVQKFAWALFLISSTGQRTKMHYSGSFLKASNELAVTAKPAGYRDFFTARGKCAPDNG